MFSNCNQLKSLDLSKFNTSLVKNMIRMFSNCKKITLLDLSNFDTSLVTNMIEMFYNCNSLISLDISGFNMVNIQRIVDLFYNLTNLKYINLNDIKTSELFLNEINKELNKTNDLIVCQNSNIITNTKIRKICCNYNFETHLCKSSNYITLYYSQSYNYTNYLNWTYSDSNELNIISGSKIELHYNKPITNTEKYFSRESDSNNANIESIDLSQFDSSKVTNMNSLFSGCTALKSINFSNINTSSVLDMSNMFYNCRSLQILNLSNFDTSYLLNMNSMFRNAQNLISLDISNFDTSKVTDMGYLFSGCSSLKNLYYLSVLDSSSVIVKTGMFDGCTQLFGPDNQDYQSGYNNSEVNTIVLLGFNMYSLINSRINFNIYFFSLEYFEFPQLLNFTSIITYNSILRILDDENNVNCQKQEIEEENQSKYKCIIDITKSDIKNILLKNDINFQSENIDLVISPLATEYMNNLQNLPKEYDNLFNGSNIFLLEKSILNQNGNLFNISGIMNDDPYFEVNKNITLIAYPENEQEKREINCIIFDNTSERYILNCRLDENIKYDLNNSISLIDKDILLITFENKSSIIYNNNNNNTNSSQYHYRMYSKKNSGLNTGAIIAIILVPIIALALIISTMIFLKRKSNNKIVSDISSSEHKFKN